MDYGGGMTTRSRPVPKESVSGPEVSGEPSRKESVAGLEEEEEEGRIHHRGTVEGRGGGQGGGIYEGGSDGWTGVGGRVVGGMGGGRGMQNGSCRRREMAVPGSQDPHAHSLGRPGALVVTGVPRGLRGTLL